MLELEWCLCKITFGALTKALRGWVTLQKEQPDTCWKTLNQAKTPAACAEMFPRSASAITCNMQKAQYQYFAQQMYPENAFVPNGKRFQTERKHIYSAFRHQS